MDYKRIEWAPGYPNKGVEAEQAYTALEVIREKKGNIEPEYVVAAAKSRRHVLHKCFEWRDDEAAKQFRLGQARTLIRSVRVVMVDGPKEPVRVYGTTRVEATDRKKDTKLAYERIDLQMADPDQRPQVIQRALNELLAVQRKYRALQELAVVWRGIEEVQSALTP